MQKVKSHGGFTMDLKKLIKMLEVETDKEKIDKIIQKIDSLIIIKRVV